MMILHITDKLRKKLHISELTRADATTGKLLRWYSHLFTAQRVQYVLTTNAASLFSVVIYGRGLTDDGDYTRRFLGELGEHLEDLELRLLYDRVIRPNSGQITLAKTSDRSVLGSMNDMVSLCKHKLDFEESSPWRLTQELNGTPFSAIGRRYPRDVIGHLALD